MGKPLVQCCLILLRQRCTGKTLCNVVLDAPQHCTEKNPVQCCLNTLGTTFCKKITSCNVVQEAPDNIAHEKIMFNIVVILLGQYCTCENPVQYFPRDSRQHCTGKKTSALSSEHHHFSAIFSFDRLIF